MYWGLDYPPLTAYHSWVCGFMWVLQLKIILESLFQTAMTLSLPWFTFKFSTPSAFYFFNEGRDSFLITPKIEKVNPQNMVLNCRFNITVVRDSVNYGWFQDVRFVELLRNSHTLVPNSKHWHYHNDIFFILQS